jgi:hypothetical protein
MSYIKEIYSYTELNKLIHNGIITESFWVSSTLVNQLKGVKEIRIGNLGSVHFQNLIDIGELEYVDCSFSFFGDLHSLNNLKYVGGVFRFGAPLKSLGLLQEIKSDFRPTTSDLEDLGCLKRVGGTLDLRGLTKLSNLSPLKEVGGNINLVKSLKDKYDLSKIHIKGRTIYWNTEPIFFQGNTILQSTRIPPPWENHGPYEFEKKLVIPNDEQLDFYNHFKKSFVNGEYIDVGGMRSYIRYYIYELRKQCLKDSDIDSLSKKYETLRKYYPNLSHDTENIEAEIGRELGIDKYKLMVLPHEVGINWERYIKNLVNEFPQRISIGGENSNNEDFVRLLIIGLKVNSLTNFGKENEKEIHKITVENILRSEEKENALFARKFVDKNKYYKADPILNCFNATLYKHFFDSNEEFDLYMEEHNFRMKGVPKENISDPKYFPPILEFALKKTFARLLRESENELRKKIGLPLVGEGWISETDLYYKIKNAFPNFTILQHGKPKWLGLQHFDIYFSELNIAIEYQGIQHFEEIEIFGGKEGFAKAQLNDQIKREKCNKNDCILLEVMPDTEFGIVLDKIQKAILSKST